MCLGGGSKKDKSAPVEVPKERRDPVDPTYGPDAMRDPFARQALIAGVFTSARGARGSVNAGKIQLGGPGTALAPPPGDPYNTGGKPQTPRGPRPVDPGTTTPPMPEEPTRPRGRGATGGNEPGMPGGVMRPITPIGGRLGLFSLAAMAAAQKKKTPNAPVTI